MSLLARSLGKLMPLWYALCLALLATAAYIHRHEEALISLLIAMAVWIAVIVYTFSALVPINKSRRFAATGSLTGNMPAGS